MPSPLEQMEALPTEKSPVPRMMSAENEAAPEATSSDSTAASTATNIPKAKATTKKSAASAKASSRNNSKATSFSSSADNHALLGSPPIGVSEVSETHNESIDLRKDERYLFGKEAPVPRPRNKASEEELLIASCDGNLKKVKELVEGSQVDVNCRDKEDETPLALAVIHNHLHVVMYLHERKATIDTMGSEQCTPLHYGVWNNANDCATYLIDNGANVSAKNSRHQQPLLFAAMCGNTDMFNLLLSKGADINCKDRYKMVPIIESTQSRHFEIVKICVEQGANLEAVDFNGRTALIYGVLHSSYEIIKYLVEAGAKLSYKNARGRVCSVLKCSRVPFDDQIFNYLISKVTSGNATDVSTIQAFSGVLPTGMTPAQKDLLKTVKSEFAPAVKVANRVQSQKTQKTQSNKQSNLKNSRQNKKRTANAPVLIDVEIEDEDPNAPLTFTKAAWKGDIAAVETFLENGEAVDSRDKDGDTALIIAAHQGHLHVVKLLVERGADIEAKDSDGDSVLMNACNQGASKVVAFLLENRANIYARDVDGRTCLQYACSSGDLDTVKTIIGKCVGKGSKIKGINTRDNDGYTPLMYGVWKMHFDVVNYLLQNGADIYAQASYGNTALMLACENNDVDMVELFLSRKDMNIEARDRDGRTALIHAAYDGHFEVLRLLVEMGNADIEANTGKMKNGSITTPLLQAAYWGHLDICKFLVGKGANILEKVSASKTAESVATANGHLDTAAYFRRLVKEQRAKLVLEKQDWEEKQADGLRKKIQKEVEAAKKDEISKLKSKLEKSQKAAPVYRRPSSSSSSSSSSSKSVVRGSSSKRNNDSDDLEDNSGETVTICRAAWDGDMQAVVALVEKHGAQLEETDNDGDTALLGAVHEGHTDIVRYLVRNGASMDARDSDNMTPLLLASSKGHNDIAKYLRQKIALRDTVGTWPGVGSMDENGENEDFDALMTAANQGDYQTIVGLVAKGVDIDCGGSGSDTPLIGAVRHGHLQCAEYFVKLGANAKEKTYKGRNILMCAPNTEMVSFVLDQKLCDINESDDEDITALARFAGFGQLDIVKVLVQHGAALEVSGLNGFSALMNACYDGHAATALYLIKSGADVNKIDNDGYTSLVHAAQNGFLDTVIALTEAGIDIDCKGYAGDNALMAAVTAQSLPIIKYLVSCNVKVNYVANNGWSALTLAAHSGFSKIVKYFVTRTGPEASDLNLKDNESKTAVMMAAQAGHLGVVRILIRAGADLEACTDEEHGAYNALDFALMYKNQECATMLRDAIQGVQPQSEDEPTTGDEAEEADAGTNSGAFVEVAVGGGNVAVGGAEVGQKRSHSSMSSRSGPTPLLGGRVEEEQATVTLDSAAIINGDMMMTLDDVDISELDDLTQVQVEIPMSVPGVAVVEAEVEMEELSEKKKGKKSNKKPRK